jgi:putative tryptophan/tyrosine transport system substrate-binding protein
MRRREFIVALGGAAAWPFVGRAQQRFHIGLLVTGGSTPLIELLVSTLAGLGYSDGKNAVIERRFAEGNLNDLRDFAADLVRLHVDVIVTVGTPAGFAAKQATGTIPIVLAGSADPVGVGLVASLARPGGNVTGNSLMSSDLSAKRLEILLAAAPSISRIAILWDSSILGWLAVYTKPKLRQISRIFCLEMLDRAILMS